MEIGRINKNVSIVGVGVKQRSMYDGSRVLSTGQPKPLAAFSFILHALYRGKSFSIFIYIKRKAKVLTQGEPENCIISKNRAWKMCVSPFFLPLLSLPSLRKSHHPFFFILLIYNVTWVEQSVNLAHITELAKFFSFFFYQKKSWGKRRAPSFFHLDKKPGHLNSNQKTYICTYSIQ